jgi:hypothetical protein
MPEETHSPGIELKLENGMVIKGDNAEEALKSAAKIIEDNVKSYRETKAELDRLSAQFQEFQSRPPAPPPKTEASNFKERYYQLLNEDPIEAQNYLDSVRFGIQKPSDVPARFNEMYERISVLDGQTLAASFVNAHPEFPSDNEAAQVLTGRVRDLQRQGHPTDLHTMEMAWNQVVNEGKARPLEQRVEQSEELPPSPGGTGSAMSDAELRKAENLSDKELMALLKSKGML